MLMKTKPMVYGPYENVNVAEHGGELPAHIEGRWTWPDHFAHCNYQRGHLPQLCIIASGWKARVLAFLLFWAME